MNELENLYDQLQALNIVPQYFGLGFIQVKINSLERYHFYHPNLLPVLNIEEEVHNHRYNFTSEVILGQVTNKIYDFYLDEKGTYIKENETCNEKIKLNEKQKYKEKGNIILELTDKIQAGEKYHMNYSMFHTVQTQYAITKLTRSEYLQDYAQVIRPINSKPICPFSVKLTILECWKIINQVIKSSL